MARREEPSATKIGRRGRISRLRGAIARNARKLTSKLHRKRAEEPERMEMTPSEQVRTPAHHARPTRRQTDIPLDLISNTYTPPQTSLKGSFRTNGEDRQRDQELAGGYADERWNDEDRLTNKSGDPRIGTHRRSYESAQDRERKETR